MTGGPGHARLTKEEQEARALDKLSIDAIRCLSMDGVQAANSGHPGTPMAMAPVAYTIWNEFLAYDPSDPIWFNRDRFVLSIGHASMLLYSMLHLTKTMSVDEKYETLGRPSVLLEDIKKFRQLDSRCPGHPEYRWTSGVETTTGPLGQGVATSVGMAIASKWLGATYNKPDFEVVNYDVYALCGDGCMMEGVQAEAASLAGHLKLDNLCWLYDNNKITIEGHTDWAFSEDVATRFIAYGWNVQRVGDANDIDRLGKALQCFKNEKHRPTLIIVDSHIAFGAPNKQDTSGAHGSPLGDAEIQAAKEFYGYPKPTEKFYVPEEVYKHFEDGIGARGKKASSEWNKLFAAYKAKYPAEAEALDKIQKRELPAGWDKNLKEFEANEKGLAGRDASGKVLNWLAEATPWFLGGSADLAPSTKTRLTFEGAGDFTATNRAGRNFHFGIREHAMGSIMNGMSLSKLRPFGSQFLIFSDYSRPTLRLSALMEIPVIYIYTHDSIAVGEDGPTHQPIEHLASLRAIPGLITFRPGDANEILEMWRYVMQLKHEPVAMLLSRQNLPTLCRKKYASAAGVAKGGYVLADAKDGKPELIIMASGGDIQFAVGAYEQLTAAGKAVRVVSMASWELFDHQSQEYRDSVLPPDVKKRVSIEESSTFGWSKFVGPEGRSIGMSSFGASGPMEQVMKKFGFSTERVVEVCNELLA